MPHESAGAILVLDAALSGEALGGKIREISSTGGSLSIDWTSTRKRRGYAPVAGGVFYFKEKNATNREFEATGIQFNGKTLNGRLYRWAWDRERGVRLTAVVLPEGYVLAPAEDSAKPVAAKAVGRRLAVFWAPETSSVTLLMKPGEVLPCVERINGESASGGKIPDVPGVSFVESGRFRRYPLVAGVSGAAAIVVLSWFAIPLTERDPDGGRGIERLEESAAPGAPERRIREGMGKTWAVLIANSGYTHWGDLKGEPYKDVERIAGVLAEYEFDEIFVEKDVGMEDFGPFFANLNGRLEDEDVQSLFLYYAGHGDYDELLDKGYWIPVDAKKSKGRIGYLGDTDVRGYLEVFNRHVRHVLLLSDSCFSGSLVAFRADDIEPTAADLRNLSVDASKRSAFGITSGRKEERVANESKFSVALEDVLERNQARFLRSSDVAFYVGKKVREVMGQQPQSGAIGRTHEFGEFVFVRKPHVQQ